MRFLADENIPGDAVAEIEAAGHDIVWVRTVAPGSKDADSGDGGQVFHLKADSESGRLRTAFR